MIEYFKKMLAANLYYTDFETSQLNLNNTLKLDFF